jgi:hypothetical protein
MKLICFKTLNQLKVFKSPYISFDINSLVDTVLLENSNHPVSILDMKFSQWLLWRNTIFWDITSYSLVEVHWYSGGTYCLQKHKLSKLLAISRQKALLCLLFWGYVPLKYWWTTTGLHGVTPKITNQYLCSSNLHGL